MASVYTGSVLKCEVCSQEMPLRLPEPEEAADNWVCAGCGTAYYAIVDETSPPELLQNVRPRKIEFKYDDLVHATEEIEQFVGSLNLGTESSVEKRTANRRVFHAAIPVQPVDENFRPLGEVFMAVTHDISVTGLCMFYNRAVEDEYLAVELDAAGGQTLQVVIRVCRCRPMGRFYQIAGEFITQLGK